ncbi:MULTISPECIES: flavin reductase [unclassified Agrobacterium]|uniref:flavin reductase n=1 Tax=unclassified Agrobacterium TaxID=2632611 RepID=UPI00244A4D25|nr:MULTISPECIES: flavin reductase [unclassified Agrobacterium]MDH0614940.1 flavin reductase [Agrobacterium sp. GD03872]MDH0699516.1 flavin reductase [Agrobacterium sp. GD03871]MDH1062002.1 flavin reductase [Agrobacterium sp. GD03992]MDH2211710.1 flavin reductase [Agrobacterium sp. GD03643]MDH2220402.1 flavin reductase [Agrobacterium sp. GD03638]
MTHPVVARSEFRDAMARVCAPVNVITTNGPAGRGGFTATAMCSVTDEPPTLLVCMNSNSAQAGLFLENRRFCVNVLTGDHKELAGFFAGREADMASRYAAANWVDLASGNQALSDAIVSFDCYLKEARLVGTHNIMIGEVVEIRARRDGHALLYFDRNFVHVPSVEAALGG